MTWNTPDISEWLDFYFYDRAWWLYTKKPAMTNNNVTFGRWLGISHKIGSDMCYWVLTVSGNVIARTTVQHVTCNEYLDPVMCEIIKTFDDLLKKRLDDTNFVNPEDGGLYIDKVDDEDDASHVDRTQTPGQDEYANMNIEERTNQGNINGGAYNKCIGVEVIMEVPREGPMRATVRRRVETRMDHVQGNITKTH